MSRIGFNASAKEVLGFFDREEDALSEGYKRFYPQCFLVHQIRSREPLIRIPYWRQWQR
jgi:hypothetical protein